MAGPKEPKKEIIKVDKEFLDLMLKQMTELQKEVKALKENPPQQQPAKVAVLQIDSLFWCQEIAFMPKPMPMMTPMEQSQHNTKLSEFRKKLQTLMREHRIGQVTAMVLQKQ